MKNIYISVSAGILSIAVFLLSINIDIPAPELTIGEVESISQNESGSGVNCRCSKAIIFANHDCLSSNDGNVCAQSSSGGNIHCQSYNSNCGGTDN